MRELAKLHADWKSARGKERKLQAQLTYASYLAAHGTQVFFNDLFWHGFQREALLTRREDPRDIPPFSGSQYEKRRADERPPP